nr:MAG TPA: hypothetical protein [Caudoviricetes sp.]
MPLNTLTGKLWANCKYYGQLHPVDVSWRLTYRGYTWIINDVRLLDESRPYYLQLTATAVNGSGEAL